MILTDFFKVLGQTLNRSSKRSNDTSRRFPHREVISVWPLWYAEDIFSEREISQKIGNDSAISFHILRGRTKQIYGPTFFKRRPNFASTTAIHSP
ncbi:hypothetical protein BUQ74_19110 [Leptospira weilii serovar Heyan]|nr:hypothetical protein BUQ74_19110 [Leptospira weilii serovar Heyan]